MALNLVGLTPEVRSFALSEIATDQASGDLYISDNLNGEGARLYPRFLTEAVTSGTDETLKAALQGGVFFNTHERPRAHHKTGTIYQPQMRSNAAQMLAEGEFNRFYLRGLCLYAMDRGIDHLVVYRARQSIQPRPGSEKLMGSPQDPKSILVDLRQNIGLETILKIPGGPNSGISLKLPPDVPAD